MKLKGFTYLLIAALGMMLVACANIGSPSGGPRDYTPPVVLKSSPAPRALNFKGKKVTINFDEIVTLKDQQKKVVISPAQKEPASIKSLGKSVQVEFNDELKPNTTYTIDFSDAIQDNNEGNRLDGYCFTFSTGDSIDTLSVSGIVLRAKDLEPMQNMLVGLQDNLNDSAFSKCPFVRLGKTNDKGEFTIQGVHPGRYHIFALNDLDGNYMMARGEDYAFSDSIIIPSVQTYQSNDTTFTFDHRIDTVLTNVTHTEYLPNDILLSMFNEGYKKPYIKKTARIGRNKLQVQFSTQDTLPRMDVILPKEHAKDWYKLERNETNDSLFYWITDSALIKSDSIFIDMHYQKMDTLDNVVEGNDTIKFIFFKAKAEAKEKAKQQKERDEMLNSLKKLQEQRDKLVAEGKPTKDVDFEMDEIRQKLKAEVPVLKMKPEKEGIIDITDTVIFKFDIPIASINQAGIHLERQKIGKKDTTWVNVPTQLQQVSDTQLMRYMLPFKLNYEGLYRLTIDSASVYSIYGATNDSVGCKFAVRSEDEYGYIILHVNSGDTAFVELLDKQEKVLRHQRVTSGQVRFNDLTPGDYYARLIIDANGNDKWDTGNYGEHLQPEEVYYFPVAKKLKVRKGWGGEETWNIYATPINDQKPLEIKRNKPETKKDSLEKKEKKNDNEEDEFNSNSFGRNTYSGNKYQDYSNGVR